MHTYAGIEASYIHRRTYGAGWLGGARDWVDLSRVVLDRAQGNQAKGNQASMLFIGSSLMSKYTERMILELTG